MSYRVIITKKAAKEAKLLSGAGLKPKADELLTLLQENPFAPYPPYEKLKGEMHGLYSRRINIQHRLVYTVDERERIVKILRLWTHYE